MICGGMERACCWRELRSVAWPELAGCEEAVQCEIQCLRASESSSLRSPSNKEIARST